MATYLVKFTGRNFLMAGDEGIKKGGFVQQDLLRQRIKSGLKQ
jgi:hypothetical protein